ncbi:hypothetical protein [Klebsiella sp. P1CD1]|uniref:hypothetical protein n=1 Tax=Klebsiella sp. P1CD1 TaxID=2267618 RepID=UPI001980DCA8|nr:hypothetical protein [Klebsiella sp. P1CD1]
MSQVMSNSDWSIYFSLYPIVGIKTFVQNIGYFRQIAHLPAAHSTSQEQRHNAVFSVDGDITTNGTITASDDVIGAGISLDNHVHDGVASGGSTTSGPQ